jgi:hypothetical protein
VSRARLFETAIWLFTLFCIVMMFVGPLAALARRLRGVVNGMP